VLGPEQLNVTPRLSPVIVESSAAINVSEKMAREIGLSDNQIIRGVIATRGGLIKLLMNNRELAWTSTKKFKPGDGIDFRVRNSVNGKILQPISVEIAKPLTTANSVTGSGEFSRLLSLLYRPSLDSIQKELFKPSVARNFLAQSLDPNPSQTIDQIMYSMKSIVPSAVREALLGSGLFGEFFLKNHVSGHLDTKQLMRKLLLSSKLTGSAKGNVEQIIDEIESRQIEALQAQQNQEVSYNFVLSFIDANPVEVHFHRGTIEVDTPFSSWVINLHTESEGLGGLWLKTTVGSNLDIDMTLWADRIEATEKAKEAAPSLEKSLVEFGLKLTKLTILNAPRPSVDAVLFASGHVLDVKT